MYAAADEAAGSPGRDAAADDAPADADGDVVDAEIVDEDESK